MVFNVSLMVINGDYMGMNGSDTVVPSQILLPV